MNKHWRRGSGVGEAIVGFFGLCVGAMLGMGAVGGGAYNAGAIANHMGLAVVRKLPDGSLKVYRKEQIKDMPAIGSIVTFEASPLESGVRVTEGRVHKTDGRYVHVRPLLNGVEQAEYWKLTPCEILGIKVGE